MPGVWLDQDEALRSLWEGGQPQCPTGPPGSFSPRRGGPQPGMLRLTACLFPSSFSAPF